MGLLEFGKYLQLSKKNDYGEFFINAHLSTKMFPSVNTYDSQFHLTDVTDPLGHTVHNGYDGEQHLIRASTYPASGRSIAVAKTYPTGWSTPAATERELP